MLWPFPATIVYHLQRSDFPCGMESNGNHAYDGFTMTISSSMMASSQCHYIQENDVGLERRGAWWEGWVSNFMHWRIVFCMGTTIHFNDVLKHNNTATCIFHGG